MTPGLNYDYNWQRGKALGNQSQDSDYGSSDLFTASHKGFDLRSLESCAVKSLWGTHRGWVAERERASADRVRGQRGPIYEVGGNFQYRNRVGFTREIEPIVI